MMISVNKLYTFGEYQISFWSLENDTEYFPERNDLGYLKLTNGAICSSESPKIAGIAHKTAFCTELNLLTPFSFGNDNCLILEIIFHFA